MSQIKDLTHSQEKKDKEAVPYSLFLVLQQWDQRWSRASHKLDASRTSLVPDKHPAVGQVVETVDKRNSIQCFKFASAQRELRHLYLLGR